MDENAAEDSVSAGDPVLIVNTNEIYRIKSINEVYLVLSNFEHYFERFYFFQN